MRTTSALRNPNGLAFLSASWVLLLVIFVFALIPAGSAQSKAFGSAFDPSTSVVSLKQTPKQLGERRTVVEPDNQPDSTVWVGVPSIVSFQQIDRIDDHGSRWSIPPLARNLAAGMPTFSHHVRAPPAN
ncbi:hypothetical protein [Croceicoccus estronivorus]|uniref:hypothetical protein n=1 Tax=Croceicoccus estronivorus TaxID=1172626 RepID=UPI0012E9503C|nr:hypothetical protein [Croceicoccus estronivorus]